MKWKKTREIKRILGNKKINENLQNVKCWESKGQRGNKENNGYRENRDNWEDMNINKLGNIWKIFNPITCGGCL